MSLVQKDYQDLAALLASASLPVQGVQAAARWVQLYSQLTALANPPQQEVDGNNSPNSTQSSTDSPGGNTA